MTEKTILFAFPAEGENGATHKPYIYISGEVLIYEHTGYRLRKSRRGFGEYS